MRHFSKIIACLVLVFGIMSASAQDAEAGKRGRIIAGTILGAIALGILADRAHEYDDAYAEDRCYEGKPICRKRRICWENKYGEERCKWRRQCRPRVYCD